VALAPGDWLVIFTDGLVEAVNAGDEEYGEAKLLLLLEKEEYQSSGIAEPADGWPRSLCRQHTST
jgi:serine phosphatase RsbU (regulator of sigma subunit)